jgi:hypothetical protein
MIVLHCLKREFVLSSGREQHPKKWLNSLQQLFSETMLA